MKIYLEDIFNLYIHEFIHIYIYIYIYSIKAFLQRKNLAEKKRRPTLQIKISVKVHDY